MSRVVMVVPSIAPDWTRGFLASLAPELVHPATRPVPPTRPREPTITYTDGERWTDGAPDLRLVVVWNDVDHNLGVAGSWNVGVDECLRTGADWLTVCSAATRFGGPGGADWIKRLDEFADVRPDVPVVEAAGGLGWHLLSFSRSALEKVGRFDPVFHPAYSEDLDWSHRFQIAYGRDSRAPDFVGPLWPKVEIDASLVEVAHGIKHGGVVVDFTEIERRYVAKWGATSPNERFTHPYGDESLDWTFTGPYPGVE